MENSIGGCLNAVVPQPRCIDYNELCSIPCTRIYSTNKVTYTPASTILPGEEVSYCYCTWFVFSQSVVCKLLFSVLCVQRN